MKLQRPDELHPAHVRTWDRLERYAVLVLREHLINAPTPVKESAADSSTV